MNRSFIGCQNTGMLTPYVTKYRMSSCMFCKLRCLFYKSRRERPAFDQFCFRGGLNTCGNRKAEAGELEARETGNEHARDHGKEKGERPAISRQFSRFLDIVALRSF